MLTLSIKANGEIRGQIIRYAREGYTINMTGSQVEPPVASAAYGSGIVSTSRFDDNAHYLWNVGGLSSTATGAHFHKEKTEANGVEIYDMTSVMLTSGTNVSAEGYWDSADINPFLPVNSLQLSKDSVYLDIHNALFPDGEIRGQVVPGYRSYLNPPALGILDNQNEAWVSLAPNPAQNEIRINAKNKPIESIELITTYGHIIYRVDFNKNTPGTTATVNLSDYREGIYFMRVNGNDYSVLKKIIKN